MREDVLVRMLLLARMLLLEGRNAAAILPWCGASESGARTCSESWLGNSSVEVAEGGSALVISAPPAAMRGSGRSRASEAAIADAGGRC